MRMAWAWAWSILFLSLLPMAAPAVAQDERTAADDERLAVTRALRCPTPANPRGMHAECVGQPFDFADTLSRGMAGVRSELRLLGITPTASYTAQLMGNPTGGQSTGVTYAGTFELLLHWDVARVLPVSGLSLTLGAAWSTGRSLSADEIGNVFAVQSAYTAPPGETNSVTLGLMYLQQRLLDDRLMLAAGRLAPAEAFATMPVLNNYLNGGINATPGSLTNNILSFMAYPPGAQWGAQGLYYLTPAVQIAAGVFNASVESALGAKNGTEFSLGGHGTGVLSVVQITYVFNPSETGFGLPGLYVLGGMYDSSRFDRLAGPDRTEHGNDSVYAMFQQMIYREGGPRSLKGLTLWGEIAGAPRSSVSPLPLFVSGGLSYLGLVPGRGDDVAALGAVYGRLSRDLSGASAETVLEANYQFTITGGLAITPDLQYVFRPGGVRGVGNALVLGAQVTLSF